MKTLTIFSVLILFSAISLVSITTPAAFADQSEVTIEAAQGSGAPGCEETADGCYIPSTATVDVGGKVIMSNPDTAAHTFTAGSPNDGPTGEFDTGLIMAGGLYEYYPDTVGEIPYFCMVHPWMTGIIVVNEEWLIDEAAQERANQAAQERAAQERADQEKILWIALGMAGAVIAGGIIVFISRKKKPSDDSIQWKDTPANHAPTSDIETGRKCNVCETNIPHGVNVCPSCGDTYS